MIVLSEFLALVLVGFWILSFILFPFWFAVYAVILSFLGAMWGKSHET